MNTDPTPSVARRVRLALLAISGALAMTLHIVHVRRPSPTPLSRHQAVERAARISLGIAPQTWRFGWELLDNGKGLRWWLVEALDSQGQGLVRVRLDALTGETTMVSVSRRLSGPSGLPVRSESAAIRRAWTWARATGVAAQAAEWRLAHPPEKGKGIWIVRWQSPGRNLSVKIDDRNGFLSSCDYYRKAWAPPVPGLLPPSRGA